MAGVALLSRTLLLLFMLLGDAAFPDYDTSTPLVPGCLRLRVRESRGAPEASNGEPGAGRAGIGWAAWQRFEAQPV